MTLRYLNIEVALGVVTLSFIAQRLTNTNLPFSWYVVVPLTTWAVYIADRVLDASRSNDDDLAGRHRFASRYRRLLTLLAVIAAATAGVVAVVAFPATYWLAASVLGIFTLLHRLLQRTTRPLNAIVKDVNVAVTYAASAWAIPIVMIGVASITFEIIAAFLAMVMIVLAGVLWLSVLDHDRDARRGDPSIAVVLGKKRARSMIIVLSITTIVLCLYLLMQGADRSSMLVMCAMALIYAVVPFNRFAEADRVRILVDCVLLLPAILVIA